MTQEETGNHLPWFACLLKRTSVINVGSEVVPRDDTNIKPTAGSSSEINRTHGSYGRR